MLREIYDLHSHRILLVVFFAAFAASSSGCGSPVVDASRVVPAQAAQTVRLETGNVNPVTSDFPNVPASSVVKLRPGSQRQPAQYHETQPGETPASIANRYGLPLNRLLEANGLESTQSISPGMILYVPHATDQ